MSLFNDDGKWVEALQQLGAQTFLEQSQHHRLAFHIMSLEVSLNRADRVYKPGVCSNPCTLGLITELAFVLRTISDFSHQDLVTGVIRVKTKGGLSHNGVSVNLSGRVTFIMSSKSVGMIDSIYNSLKPITLADLTTQVSKGGKLYPVTHHFYEIFDLLTFEAGREMETKT